MEEEKTKLWIVEEHPETQEIVEFFEKEGFKLHYRDVWVLEYTLDREVEKVGVKINLCELVQKETMLSFNWLQNWKLIDIKFHKDLKVEFIFTKIL